MLSILKSIAEKFIKKISRESVTPNRQTTSGVISKKSDSGVLIEENGDIQNISGSLNQEKFNNESSSKTDISYEHNIVTNRLNLEIDDITINGCKLNPQLYSLYGIVQQSDKCIQGNLNIYGTVLVKSFDVNLNKHVYIRRYIRTPLLYNKMTPAVIDERFDIHKPDGSSLQDGVL